MLFCLQKIVFPSESSTQLVHFMIKPIVHIILPEMPADSYEARVMARALDSFIREMHPFYVVVHKSDLAYEKAKNPHCGREAQIYCDTERAMD